MSHLIEAVAGRAVRACAAAVFLLSQAGASLAAGGEAGNYLVVAWDTEKGLPSSSVTAIAQTRDGYLWAGTYNGLARFDGVRFVTFDPRNSPGLAHARVRRLYVDDAGTLWINTFDGSLTSYRGGDFKQECKLEWKGDNSPDAWVTAVSLRTNREAFLLHTGELIVRNASAGGWSDWKVLQPPGFSSGELAVEDGAGGIWCRGRDQRLWRYDGKNFQPAPADSGLKGQIINTLVADAQGRLWAGTEKEIAMWDGARFANETPTNGEAELNVSFLHVCGDGDAWVFAGERVRKARGRQWIGEAEACRGVFTGRLERLGVQEDRAGGSWIYHYGKGLYHVHADGRTTRVTGEENFPGERVDCFFEDHEGNLWAGVDRGGLVRVRERKKFNVLAPTEGRPAVTVAEDEQGAVWAGTYGDGLVRIDERGWRTLSLSAGSRREFVFSVFPETADRLWLSAGEEDLLVRTDGEFQVVAPAVHGVKALLRAHDGRLWIGNKIGLMNLTQGRLHLYHPVEGINRVDIRALAEDANGAVWAGAGDGVIYRIAGTNVARFQPQDKLASQAVWSLLADANGSVWAGTSRGGLLRLRGGRFTRYTAEDGLPDDTISQILDDGHGALWIGSNKGIFRVAKSELDDFADGKTRAVNCTSYGRYDGLPSLECSGSYQPACWKTRDGRLLFCTLKGVVSVQPEELTMNRRPPPVVIEEVLVDGEAQVLPRGAPLVIAPGKGQVEFHFTGLSYASPDRVRFRYKLDDLDREWVEAGAQRSQRYNFLQPGKYVFHVTACNNDGVWNGTGAALEVVVQPYFFQTEWFFWTTGLGVVAGASLMARRLAVRRLRRQLEFVERQRAVERDRTRIAKDIHDDLGAGLTHISLLSEIARRTPASELGGHLGQISEMARELTRAMDEIVWAVDPQNDTLDSLVTYLSKFAQDYLSVAGIRCRLDVPEQTPPWTLRAEVRHNLFLAFKETLNNIVKHSGATEVWLRLALEPGSFALSLEDNGRGLGGESSRPGRVSAGRGLGNLDVRLAASGGRCVVASEPGKGTRVQFIVQRAAAPSPELATGKKT